MIRQIAYDAANKAGCVYSVLFNSSAGPFCTSFQLLKMFPEPRYIEEKYRPAFQRIANPDLEIQLPTDD
jgi:hypothetical protein